MNNIDKSSTTYKYPVSYRHSMNQEVQEINEVLKEHKELETQYKKLPSVEFKNLKVGAEYGLAYTGNNCQYYIRVNVIGINAKSARIMTTNSGRVWTVNKITKQNRLFELEGFDIERLSILEKAIRDYMSGKINEFWKKRIAAAEEQHKQEGVYKESTTYLIDPTYPNYLRPIKDNYRISV